MSTFVKEPVSLYYDEAISNGDGSITITIYDLVSGYPQSSGLSGKDQPLRFTPIPRFKARTDSVTDASVSALDSVGAGTRTARGQEDGVGTLYSSNALPDTDELSIPVFFPDGYHKSIFEKEQGAYSKLVEGHLRKKVPLPPVSSNQSGKSDAPTAVSEYLTADVVER